MQKLFDSIKWIILAITAPIGIVLGAIANPEGAVNGFLCRIIDVVASAFPSTPNNLKLSSLLASAGDSIPLVGRAVVFDIFTTAAAMLTIVLLIKLYQLIPFKMS
jgi:ABC-type dipeptide/oligopeptide/nickel transport system permease subunit